MNKLNDIMNDDDFKVLGKKKCKADNPKKVKQILRWLGVLLLVAAVAMIWTLAIKKGIKDNESVPEEFFDPQEQVYYYLEAPHSDEKMRISEVDADDIGRAYTEYVTRTVNDITLDIYIPHNATPKLTMKNDRLTNRVVFSTQAADIRADNFKIVGAFVLRGDPLAWGKSKKGYCAIIDGKITIGMADSTPLFEKATECRGYFFRQYPLVINGVMIENAPKGKSIRKALCERKGEIFIAMTDTPESFHDFAQALADLGVDNAIYLVGSSSYGYWKDSRGKNTIIGVPSNGPQDEYENYIQWVGR